MRLKEQDSIVFVVNIPSFYKKKLFNRIALKRKVYAVFTDKDHPDRNADFFSGGQEYESRQLGSLPLIKKLIELWGLIRGGKYSLLVIGGWDSAANWIAAFASPKGKNAVMVESSLHESQTAGLKGLLKKLFLKRMSVVFASGSSQEKLVRKLGFEGEVVKTKGVGIFNSVPQPPYEERNEVRNFLFVGRLVEVKNLPLAIKVFNSLPQLTLNIVGFGELERDLKAMAGPNIVFHGAVKNEDLPGYYKAADVFILPSCSEVWGLVVEEALNNGTPVILSDRVGCAEELLAGCNCGLVFESGSEESLKSAVLKMTEPKLYNSMRRAIADMDFAEIQEKQAACYADYGK